MSAGDVLNPKRPRLQANERLDQVDVDALSSSVRDHLDAYSRAVEAAPRNVGSTTPTGLVFQGFGMTLNPIAPTDAKVRVQAALGVAFDSNGRLLIKESGVQIDLTLSAGNSQIYAYYVETSVDSAVRRVITVAPPFAEGGQSFPIKIKGAVGFFVRAGDQTSIVASDVVNGATTPLCFLGVANNAAGAVTMVGYDATTAPNGSFATNRITTVVAPTALPPAPTANGSLATMHGLVNAVAYMVGQALWKGSGVAPPSTANNFQAWTAHPASSVATLSEYLVAGNLVGNHTISGSLAVGGQPLVFLRTFTADNTTETFTATAHGRSTGDGPFQVSNSGGALPTGLAPATNYWWITTGANTFMLATSFSDALAGLNLSISTNGTGTQTIASTGSTTHATDAAVSRSLSVTGNAAVVGNATVGGTLGAAGTVTASGDVNVTGNVSATSYKHGLKTKRFSAQLGMPHDSAVAWSTNAGGICVQGAAPLSWQIPILLSSKKRILAARARVKCVGGAIAATLKRVSDNSNVDLGTGTTATTGAFETFTVAAGLTEQTSGGLCYQVNFGGGSGTSEYAYIEVDYDQVIA